jgi:hypothetical protein
MDYQNVTKDRSLGVTDLSVADLLKAGEDKKLKPWVSTGPHEHRKQLQINGKKVFKGTLLSRFFGCCVLTLNDRNA